MLILCLLAAKRPAGLTDICRYDFALTGWLRLPRKTGGARASGRLAEFVNIMCETWDSRIMKQRGESGDNGMDKGVVKGRDGVRIPLSPIVHSMLLRENVEAMCLQNS